jgi:hypothetical protein
MQFAIMGGGVSSGTLFVGSMYDGSLYNFGKGETAVTVSVSPKTIADSATVLIEGTVTDQSPGAKDTPAVSEASMSAWMEYLYYNKPKPQNATGVPVFLQAVGSDGTVIDITHVTSDIMGHFEYMWKPPAQGVFKILATFEGSESYWESNVSTSVGVTEALEEQTGQSVVETPDNTPMYFAISTIAIIVAIAIVGMLLYRKRP